MKSQVLVAILVFSLVINNSTTQDVIEVKVKSEPKIIKYVDPNERTTHGEFKQDPALREHLKEAEAYKAYLIFQKLFGNVNNWFNPYDVYASN